ncbi:hypothetical protein PG991_006434 [Apiospora marii]|uniref:Uncharacterized protein n=1 Tax=Apiospora marii TaxID=335849 RepID=A0ABR1SC21_9PEZI
MMRSQGLSAARLAVAIEGEGRWKKKEYRAWGIPVTGLGSGFGGWRGARLLKVSGFEQAKGGAGAGVSVALTAGAGKGEMEIDAGEKRRERTEDEDAPAVPLKKDAATDIRKRRLADPPRGIFCWASPGR